MVVQVGVVVSALTPSEFTNPVIVGVSEVGAAWLKSLEKLGAVTVRATGVICPETLWLAKE